MPSLHTRWPIFGALAAGLVALAGFWYVVLTNPEGEAVPASGGRYVEGVARAPERMNPLFAYANPTDQDIVALVFSGLVRLGPDGTPLPDLAERWEITDNGSTYVFHLREGIAWQDEEISPVAAEDVVFTYNAITNPSFRGDAGLAQLMQGVVVTARDARTVEFQLEQAYAPFLANLTVGILPSHLLLDLDADGMYNAEFNAHPIGSGPYRFRGRTREGVILESNSGYHFGPPPISTLEVRVFSDATALTTALRADDIDGALFGPETPRQQIDALRGDGSLVLHELASTAMLLVYLDTRSPLFEDPLVRRALLQSTNVPLLLQDAAVGGGWPAEAGIPPMSWAYTQTAWPALNLGEAARELEDAGWSRGRDGVRVKAGQRLSFALSTSNEPRSVAVAESVARQWRSLGAEVRVQPIDAAAYIEEHLLGRRFEAGLVEIDYGADPDPYPFWHSTQIAPPGRNLAAFSTPQMDDVLERARQTTDPERRTELYRLFAGVLAGAVPAIPLYSPVHVYAQDGRVRGFAPALLFSQSSRFASISEWYVKTRVTD